MEAPEFVRTALSHFRKQGAPFMEAWTQTLQSIPRGTTEHVISQRQEWMAILKWARPWYQRAYDGTAEPEPAPFEDGLEMRSPGRDQPEPTRRVAA